jgi:small-conductance mechanosensitive channel
VVRIVAVTAWTIAALSILGMLDATIDALDSVAVRVGSMRLTPLLVVKIALLLMIALWVATTTSSFFERRIQRSADLTPSIRVLLGKLLRLSLIVLAILLVVSSAGIDLSALALFSGAVGVGIGLGLQKIVSNFISGIILLVDKSIKPGDVISVGDTFGWVNGLAARYISVVTRDGREFLIPNEDIVTRQVTNWSYSNNNVRLDVPFRASYQSDPHAVRRIAAAAARTVDRVLEEPAPVCHMTDFGESSIDFVLRFWIEDPVEGVTNARGAVLLALWDAFRREGLEIPWSIREVRFANPVQVVAVSPSDDPPPPPRDASGAVRG